MEKAIAVYAIILAFHQHFFGFQTGAWQTGFNSRMPLNYSRHHAPTRVLYSGHADTENITEPAHVTCIVGPQFVTELSMKNMYFDVDVLVLVEWEDHRLSSFAESSRDFDVTLSRETALNIWHPKLKFENCIGGNSYLVFPGLEGPEGNIIFGPLLHSSKVTGSKASGFKVLYRKVIRFHCDLKFDAYPFDEQHCAIVLLSGNKPEGPTELTLLPLIEDLSIPPGFRMTSFKKRKCHKRNQSFYAFTECNAMVLEFRRLSSQHVMLFFIPSTLTVFLSWLSFWIDLEVVAPRVTLGLTTFLTMATQFGSALKDLPPVPEVKAIDIWMFFCIIMVFASLIEFGVAYMWRKMNLSKMEQVRQIKSLQDSEISFPPCVKLCNKCCSKLRPRHTASRIDYAARIVFPFTFFVFNVVFWSYFLP